jgi:hypothetical protein
MKLKEAFKLVSSIEPLTKADRESIEWIRQNIPIRWYCETVLQMQLDGDTGKCPRKYHNRDSEGAEFAIYPKSNTWHCFGSKCANHYPDGDIVDLHAERFFHGDKIRAIEDLWRIRPEKDKPPKMKPEFDVSIPKWAPSKANWGSERNPSAIQKYKIVGDPDYLAEVLEREKKTTRRTFVEASPLVTSEYDPDELALLIHRKLWKPEDLRCLQFNHREPYPPVIVDWAELKQVLRSSSEPFTYFMMMSCSAYQTPSRVADKFNSEDWRGKRREENTDKRRYIVYETDAGFSGDKQLRIISHLAENGGLPLVWVCSTGGKSYHAGFCVAGKSVEDLNGFSVEARRLYVDSKTTQANALCRLPNAWRRFTKDKNPVLLPEEEWRRQQVIYFDSDAITFD